MSDTLDQSATAAPQDTAAPSSPYEAEVIGLREALASRTVIGQATGLLAGRFDISIDLAWRVLGRTSNLTNLKVRDVAKVIIDAHNGDLAAEDRAPARVIADCLAKALAKVLHG